MKLDVARWCLMHIGMSLNDQRWVGWFSLLENVISKIWFWTLKKRLREKASYIYEFKLKLHRFDQFLKTFALNVVHPLYVQRLYSESPGKWRTTRCSMRRHLGESRAVALGFEESLFTRCMYNGWTARHQRLKIQSGVPLYVHRLYNR